MTSLYSQYVLEREGSSVLELEWGFAEYKISTDTAGERFLFAINFYVVPEKRDGVWALQLFKMLDDIAKQNKCKYGLGQVDVSTKTATQALHFHFHCGCKLLKTNGNLIYTYKELNYDIQDTCETISK